MDPILIRFPRQKLKGYFGLPYSGAVYGVEEKIGKSRQQPAEAEQHGLPRMDSLDYEEFAVVPGAEDHSESSHGMLVNSLCYCISLHQCQCLCGIHNPFYVNC